jgi:hypothetical protein
MATETPSVVHDDLTRALAAIADTTSGFGSDEARVAGCKRLVELLHNRPDHKIEALTRGSTLALKTIFENPVTPSLAQHAARALRSLTFKCDEGRAHIHSSGILAPMGATLRRCVLRLEPGPPWLSSEQIAAELSAIDELLMAITAACVRHGE